MRRALLIAGLLASATCGATAQPDLYGGSVLRPELRSVPIDPHGRDLPNDGSAIPPSMRSRMPLPHLDDGRAAARPRRLPQELRGVARPSLAEPAPIDTIVDLYAALGRCWRPPLREDGSSAMEVTVRVGFSADGRPFGPPRVTWTAPAAKAVQERTRAAARDAIDRCSPLPFTPGFGRAVAGRPVTVRFLDGPAI